jgi:hypothetical protein
MIEKGCIMEIREHTMILMTASCDFIEIPLVSDSLVPGMEIEFELMDSLAPPVAKRKTGISRKAAAWIAVAAMLMLAVIGTTVGFPTVSAEPAFVVNVDLNPSVILMLDEAGSVIKVKAVNADAERLNLKALRHKPMEEALAALLLEAEEAGYLNPEQDHYMVISLLNLNPDMDEQAVEQLIKRAETAMLTKDDNSLRVQILALAASQQQAERAENLQVNINEIVVQDAYGSLRTGMSEGNEVIEDTESDSTEAMVRAMLREKEHPVFEVHPGAVPGGDKIRKDKGTGDDRPHPVFDTHPGQANGSMVPGDPRVEDDSIQNNPPKEHPVFEVHPGESTRGQ